MAKYMLLVGLDYPPDRRAEAGDVVTDLPAKSIKWLREDGIIVPADEAQTPAEAVSEAPVATAALTPGEED